MQQNKTTKPNMLSSLEKEELERSDKEFKDATQKLIYSNVIMKNKVIEKQKAMDARQQEIQKFQSMFPILRQPIPPFPSFILPQDTLPVNNSNLQKTQTEAENWMQIQSDVESKYQGVKRMISIKYFDRRSCLGDIVRSRVFYKPSDGFVFMVYNFTKDYNYYENLKRLLDNGYTLHYNNEIYSNKERLEIWYNVTKNNSSTSPVDILINLCNVSDAKTVHSSKKQKVSK
jgi:hypothetical protein